MAKIRRVTFDFAAVFGVARAHSGGAESVDGRDTSFDR